MGSIAKAIVVLAMMLSSTAHADSEPRPLVLAFGARGFGFLFDESDVAVGPGVSASVHALEYLRLDVDFSYAFAPDTDDGAFFGFLISGQYPSIVESHHDAFVGLGFSDFLADDNTPCARAALGYAFTWDFVLLRIAWEPHFAFSKVECADCGLGGKLSREIVPIRTAFSANLSFGIDLL